MTDFAAVDAGDARDLVAMMDATDAWPAVRAVLGDLTRLPLRDGAADLVHAERVLQWADDPATALAELVRVTDSGGHVAVTDTDWGTFTVDHPDATAGRRLSTAALTWVPHARIARELPSTLAALGLGEILVRHDTATITAWDPGDPGQHDGPPGLPLHSIAGACARDLAPVAERARSGAFRAEVTIVTALAHR